MKILFFASDYKIGLSSLLTDQIIAYNKIESWSIVGIAGEKAQEEILEAKIKDNKIKLKRIAGLDEHNNFIGLFREIRSLILEEKPAIIHVQNNWQLCLIGLIKYIGFTDCYFKILYTLHGFRNNHVFKSIIARMIIGALLLVFADKIIYMCEYVLSKFRLLTYKMTMLRPGVDYDFFNKEFNNIDNKTLKLIFPAQFRQGKNQELIIQAFSEYCEQESDSLSELYLPGEGNLKKSCEELADKSNAKNQIFFPGLLKKKDVLLLMEKCNIGVISSNSETFGAAILEPFILGRCIITRKVGIAPDIITDELNGFFFNNSEELKNILIKLSHNKNLIKEIGDTNFRSRDLFSWSNSSKEYSRIINQLITQ